MDASFTPALANSITVQKKPFSSDYNENAYQARVANRQLRVFTDTVLRKLQFREQIAEVLEGKTTSSSVSITCIGSDAREEKGPISPLGLVIYLKNESNSNNSHPQLEEIVTRTFNSRNAWLPTIDAINLKSAALPSCLYKQSPTHVWPCRVINALPLSEEDKPLFNEVRGKLASEICGTSGPAGISKKIIEQTNERIRVYRKISFTGKQDIHGVPTVHFDMDNGIAYYQKDSTELQIRPMGFKHGVLRLVQTAANRLVIRKIKALGEEAGTEFLLKTPTNTSDKLCFLHSEGLIAKNISSTKLDELIDNYLYFLNLYHQSEMSAKIHNKSEIYFSPGITKDRRDSLVSTIESGFRGN